MQQNPARSKLISRLERKGIALEPAREVAFGVYPDDDSPYPLRRVMGDRQAAENLVLSFGFRSSKIEQVWRLLWGISASDYYTPDPARPPISDDEEVLDFPLIMPPYAYAC